MTLVYVSLAVIWFALWLFTVGLLVKYRRLADEAAFWRDSAARWQARSRFHEKVAARRGNRLAAILKTCEDCNDAPA